MSSGNTRAGAETNQEDLRKETARAEPLDDTYRSAVVGETFRRGWSKRSIRGGYRR